MTLSAQQLALGRVAYERFAEQRVALGATMPAWQAYQVDGAPPAMVLPDSEKAIWAEVAMAVQAVIPFTITDEVMEAYDKAEAARRGGWTGVRAGLRAAANAAGFRVEER